MKFLILCAAVMVSVVQGAIPKDWPKCRNGDDSCIAQAHRYVLQKYHSAVPELNLVSLDPLYVKTIVFERNPSSSVDVEVKLENSEVTGLKDLKIASVTGYKADLSGRNTLEAVVPVMSLKGHYFMDGHVLVLPIVGDGSFEITMKNVHIKFDFELKAREKDGQTYASIKHIKLDMEPEHLYMRLDNLFNGNRALSDSTNVFLNENWKSIYGEMKGRIVKSVALVLKAAVNTFLEYRPYAEIFL